MLVAPVLNFRIGGFDATHLAQIEPQFRLTIILGKKANEPDGDNQRCGCLLRLSTVKSLQQITERSTLPRARSSVEDAYVDFG